MFFFFQKNADISIFVESQSSLSQKIVWQPQFFFKDSNSTCEDLVFLCGPNLAQKPLYLVGTVLNLSGHVADLMGFLTQDP